MPLLIAALLALSATLVVLYPLLGLAHEATDAAPAQLAAASERERLARQALREVEFDYTLGNLETGDYEDLRDRYETRALAALKTRYQREQELDALIERQLDTLRQSEDDAPTPTRADAAPSAVKSAPATPRKTSTSGERTRPASVRDRRAPKRKGS